MKRLVGVLLALLVCAALLPVLAGAEVDGKLTTAESQIAETEAAADVPAVPMPNQYMDATGKYTINTELLTATYNAPAEKVSMVKTVTIPDEIDVGGVPVKVTAISPKAFYRASKLIEVNIGANVKTIGYGAFDGCSSLTGITLPDGVTEIGEVFFRVCRNLTSITIPDSVASIGDNAFYECSSLTSITLPESVTSIGNSAFWGCSSLTSITLPEGVTSIGSSAFYGCSSLTSITLPEGVTSISDDAFYGCSSLTSITLPDGVTSIGERTFSGCSSLTSITLPDGVTSIGERTFFDCSSLTSIMLPDSVTDIGEYAFYNCSSLTNITLPDSVTSIGEDAITKTTTIQCHRNTYADKWATENGYNIDYLPCAEHTVVIDAAVEPTCVVTGLTEGSHCSVCGEVMTAQAEVPAKGHSYGEPTYEWSADNKTVTASRICANDASHVESETVNVSEAVTREATRDEEGERTYTAIFNNTAFTEQTRTEKIPVLTPVENPTESPQSEQPSEPEQPIQSDEPVAPIEQPVEQVPIEQQPSDQVPGEMVPTGPAPGPHADDTGNYTINADLTATYEGPAQKVSKVKTATIPDEILVEGVPVKITAIADKAFYKASKLTKVSIGANVKAIGKSAFASCAKLKTVSGGSGVVTIGASAFKGDKALTKITIGKKVTTIGKSAFNGCKKLKTVTIKATKLKKVGSSAFKGVASSVTFKCPSKQLKAYKKLIKKAGAPSKAKYKK